MKAFFRKFSAILLAVCTAAALFAIAACGENSDNGEKNEDGKVTYTVTVTCEDNPILLTGVKARLSKADGTVAAESELTDGKATFELDKGSYTVDLVERIADMLSEYVYAQKTVTESTPSVTIEILPAAETGETVSYTVTVMKPDNTPAAGITVQLCGGPKGMCNTARTNDAGIAVFEIAAGEYEVHITPPEGFTFDNNQYKMTAEGGSLTVTLS